MKQVDDDAEVEQRQAEEDRASSFSGRRDQPLTQTRDYPRPIFHVQRNILRKREEPQHHHEKCLN